MTEGKTDIAASSFVVGYNSLYYKYPGAQIEAIPLLNPVRLLQMAEIAQFSWSHMDSLKMMSEIDRGTISKSGLVIEIVQLSFWGLSLQYVHVDSYSRQYTCQAPIGLRGLVAVYQFAIPSRMAKSTYSEPKKRCLCHQHQLRDRGGESECCFRTLLAAPYDDLK